MKFRELLSAIILYKNDFDIDEIVREEMMRIEVERLCKDGILCS